MTQTTMFIFPGQGSQYPGMGSDLCQDFPEARAVFQEANEVLGFDLQKLCAEGPEEELTLTRNTQPALLTHSVACLRVLQSLRGEPLQAGSAAGHSLGEYSALVAAGALSFADALRLVRKRGEFMGEYGEGEMVAIPMDLETVQPLAEKHFCAVAGLNLPEQTVVGGASADLDALMADAGERFPRKRLARLKTEGAFHTYYMVEAARHFRAVLNQADFQESTVKVMSNYTGDFHDPDPAVIKARLFYQLFHPVKWYAGLQAALLEGVEQFVEFGGGIGTGEGPEAKRPNLESIIKKATRGSAREIRYQAAINSATIRAAAESL